MSTYIDMLRAHQARLDANGQPPSAQQPGPEAPDRKEPRGAPPEASPLLSEDSGEQEAFGTTPALADEVSAHADPGYPAESRTTGTYMNMLRANRTRAGNAGSPPPDQQSLSEEPARETLHTELQDEAQTSSEAIAASEGFESVAQLAEETPNQPLPAAMGVTETTNTTQTAWLLQCVALLLKIYEQAGHNQPSDLSPLLKHLGKFTDAIYEDSERLNDLELEISNHIDDFRVSHLTCGDLVEKAVMMMLYGIKVCMQMHMEPPEIVRYVAASMLHNIGMALILVDTRLKESTLNDVERALIRKTPKKSLEYLKHCGVTDPVLLQAAEQVQERYDGSGPLGLSGSDIALSARITGLLSMFEALVHFRAYRERLLPRDAIRELVNRYKSQFDPAILKVLIESISLYPVGTYVQLNSGDVGQVIRVQPRLPLRPKIVLTMDRNGNKIQPREVDLREQPNLMVQRCMYAAGLASLKQGKDRA
jgi:HD domain